MRKLPFRVLPLCAAITLVPNSLYAAGPSLALEEVIVTAQKREESIQDVPISIVAFTEDKLEKMGVQDIRDMALKVPNLYIKEFPSGGGTTVQLYIRGIGQNDVQITQDPSVALYMDGVYIGTSVGTAFESADLARVEVLRGPQGTLYGRNATGGAVSLITNQADPGGMYFKQRLTGGNLDQFRARSIFNMPITDTMAAKLAYSHSERDGITENLGNGKDFGIEDRDNITADFHWDVTDVMTVDYKYDRSEIHDSSRLSQLLECNPPACVSPLLGFANPARNADGIPVEVTTDRLDKATSFDQQLKGDLTINAHTLHYAWAFNEMLTLKSITGYRDLDSFYQTAQSPTTYLQIGPDKFTITNALADTDFEQFSQEFQLLGSTDHLEWVTGVFYYRDKSEENNRGDTFFSEAVPDDLIVDYTDTKNTSIALYGQVTWTPENLDRWHFTLGGRYSDDNRKATRENSRVAYSIGGAPSGIPPFYSDYDQDFDEFNPSAVVAYDINTFSNVYAKVTTAYKAGGTSQRSQIQEAFEEGFDPEDLTAYELGYKSDFLDGRMRLNGALFYMDFEGYQQSVQAAANPAGRDFVNIDSADIAGLELDVSFAITEYLIGTFSYGYLDTSFGPSSISYRRQAPPDYIIVEETLTDSLAQAPDNSATASLDYSLPLSFATLNANINVQYQDKTNSGVVLPTGYQDSRTLLNATIGLWDIQLGNNAGRLRASLWGNNLTDEEYYISSIRLEAFDALGIGEIATFGDPRTYGVTLEYEYD